jgi:hypothetical protein
LTVFVLICSTFPCFSHSPHPTLVMQSKHVVNS